MQFDEFLAAELVPLTRYAAVLTGNRQDAHDLLSSVLEAVIAQWARVAAADHPASYVRAIIARRYITDRRTQIRRNTFRSADPYAGADHRDGDDLADTIVTTASVRGLIDGLPPTVRGVNSSSIRTAESVPTRVGRATPCKRHLSAHQPPNCTSY